MKYKKRASEYDDCRKYPETIRTVEDHSREQRNIDGLMLQGFLWEEAIQLARFHEHLYENAEMKQRIEEDEYLLFARWLYIQGALNEGEK